MYEISFRVVESSGTETSVSGYKFQNFGAHHNDYPCTYLTAAAAIGMTESEVDTFITRLDKVLTKCKKRKTNSGHSTCYQEIGSLGTNGDELVTFTGIRNDTSQQE